MYEAYVIREIKIEVFRHFPQTANVMKSRDQVPAVCGLKFAFGREVGRFQVSHLPRGFFAFIFKQVLLGECRLIDTHL